MMVMLAATLANGLADLTPTSNEAAAIQGLADAWEAYFEDATVGSTAVAAGTLTAARAALVAALTGVNAPSAGATVLQAAIIAWWGIVVPAAAVIWAGNTPPVLSATPPPGLTGLATAITAVSAANTVGSLSLSASATSIAAAIHTLNLGGATAVGPPPGAVPIL